MHEEKNDVQIALAELRLVLTEQHVVSGVVPDAEETIWVTDPGRPRRVVAVPAPTTAQLLSLVADTGPGFLVADRLAAAQRAVLDGAGWSWWDRRGMLRVAGRDGAADLTVEPVPTPEPDAPSPFARSAGRTVGLALLRAAEPPTVRELSASTGLSTGACGRTVRELREIGLIDRTGVDRRGVFRRLQAAWNPRWYGVSSRIAPRGGALDDVLRFGLEPGSAAGWALVGASALLAYGGGPVDRGAPLRLFTTDQRALAWAVRTWGVDGDGDVELAAPPAAGATTHRRPWGAATGVRWRLADPIVLGLTLAGEHDGLLEGWRPTSDVIADPPW